MNLDSPANPNSQRDEIDLIELLQGLWAQKWLIATITAIAVACAAAFAFLSKPTFEARAGVLPPRLSDIAGYNLGRREANLDEYKVGDVYRVFKLNLLSDGVKRELFQKAYLPSLKEAVANEPQDRLWLRFNDLLSVKAPDAKNNPDYFTITVQHQNPQTAADWANRYVSMVEEKTEADMKANLLTEIGTKAQSIERQIEVLRASAQQRREDRIVRLREAQQVAETVGINAPQVTAGKTSSDGDLAQFMDGNLMYMRGAKAIGAELAVLEQRKNDDPFIPELRGLENQMAFLRGVDVNPDNVSVYTLDSSAEVPQTPIKPKKALIVALGLVMGGMLGVFIAFIRIVLLRRTANLG